MNKPLVIVNPQSGGGRTGRIFSEMRSPIERALGKIDVECTERPRHATDIARAAAEEGRELVVAVGGDGTFNEVVNGLMRASKKGTRVGLIGQGTGGDFRRSLGLEHRLDHYLKALASGRERPLDVGRFAYTATNGERAQHWFVNILSAGMGGLVDRYVANSSRALGGKVAYMMASLRAMADCELGRLRCSVTLDGETSEKRLASFMIAICNGQYFGSGMHVAPMARIDDGTFEVVSMGGDSKLGFALGARKIYDARHLASEDVQHFRCQKITMDIENEAARRVFLLDVDGEPLGKLPLEVEVMSNALVLRA